MAGIVIAVAIVGFAVGATLRLQVFLSVAGLLLLLSVVFSVISRFAFLDAMIAIMAAQFIIQISYFFGLLFQALVGALNRTRAVF